MSIDDRIKSIENELHKIYEELQSLSQFRDSLIQAVVQAPKPLAPTQQKLPEKQLTPVEKELLEHKGWKAKKNEDGTYTTGSLGWGWDFADKFSLAVINAVTSVDLFPVGEYIFEYSDQYKSIRVRKGK